eukprot:9492822-Pyramimonas_sp.AAC.1
MHRKEEKDNTAAQQQKELDRQAIILAALFSFETRWGTNSDWLCMELRGDSQCVTRWLTDRYKCLNEVYTRTIASMQNQLYSLCKRHKLLSPEAGRDIWKRVYREGNEEADHETHLA